MTSAMPQDPFDRTLVEQYRAALGVAGSAELVELFLHNLEEARDALRVAVLTGDGVEVRRLGHSVKGMASGVGAVRLAAAAAAIELGDSSDVSPSWSSSWSRWPTLLATFDDEADTAARLIRDVWGIHPERN